MEIWHIQFVEQCKRFQAIQHKYPGPYTRISNEVPMSDGLGPLHCTCIAFHGNSAPLRRDPPGL